MYPELLKIGDLTIRSYGLLTLIAAVAGYLYASHEAKKELGIPAQKIRDLTVWLILASFLGGKLFFYLEDADHYFSSFENLKSNFRAGFVFYGSLLFAVPMAAWFFLRNRWPFWPMIDILAVTTCIVHGIGRIGCFLNGCCHGHATQMPWALIYKDPACQAPLNTPLHPTQLYEFTLIFMILALLLYLRPRRRFNGQLIFVYVILYALGRSLIELFRGDEARGYIIDGSLSHSQFISSLVIICAIGLYIVKRRKRGSH